MRTSLKLCMIIISAALMTSSAHVLAAQIVIDSTKQEFTIGEEFSVDVFLDTENKLINAAEGELVFPNSLLEIKRIEDGNSIMNFWVERPDVNASSTAFSGITPGGYQGDRGLIFTVVFKTKTSGSGNVLIKNIQLLQNDNNSSKLAVRSEPFPITISSTRRLSSPWLLSSDKDKPEVFRGEVVTNDDTFAGKPFLVFATQDKGSGIGHYEVKEGFWGQYATASSPYVLKNDTSDQKIYIKAFDKAGNFRLSVATPPEWLPWYKKHLGAAVLMVVLLSLLTTYLERKKRM